MCKNSALAKPSCMYMIWWFCIASNVVLNILFMHNLSQIFKECSAILYREAMVRFRFFRSRLLTSFLWHLWRCFLSVADNLGQPEITLASIKLLLHHQYLLWSLSAWHWLLYKVKCTFCIIREVQHWLWHMYIFIGGPDCTSYVFADLLCSII